MPLARHDLLEWIVDKYSGISTHMPLARHDALGLMRFTDLRISTHMPLARHDTRTVLNEPVILDFYSHASCEA